MLSQVVALEARPLMAEVEGFDPATGIFSVYLTDANNNVHVIYYPTEYGFTVAPGIAFALL